MKKPDIPENEPERLRELQKLDILDTPAEEEFDDITRLASMICGTLFSLVTIVDEQRQWFKSVEGPLGTRETSRDISFCGHALLGNEIFIIEDAHNDERFEDNPLVTSGPMIRFYAGVPLKTRSGFSIGTLCVFDPKPGSLSSQQKEGLTLLARQIEEKLERRQSDVIVDNMARILDISDAHIILFDPVQERVNYIDPGLRERLGNQVSESSRPLFAHLFPDLPYERFFTPQRMQDSDLAQRKITRTVLPNQPDGQAEIRLLNPRARDRHNKILLYQDKTELTRTRASAEEAESSFRVFYKLARQSRNAFVVTDGKGRIQWVNTSFEELTGYSSAEVIGKKPGDFLQGKDTSRMDRNRIARHLKSAEPVVQEILNYSKNGKPYWAELYIEPIFNHSGVVTHFVATQSNVSRRKEENQLLRQSRADAERANREKSQFLAKISHELRTPLNGIIGIAEKLLEEVPRELRDTVAILDQSSQHLMALLDDLLDLSHIESGQLELATSPFNLRNLLREIEQLFAPRAAMVGNELEISAPDDLPTQLLGDQTRLRQVLINLVNNAVKFTREGLIRISAEDASLAHEPGLTDDVQCNIRFSVSDSGPGISPEHHERIFESFEQLDNSSTRTFGGSGLGLAICKQLVEAMGGSIWLESEVGRGSQFSFEIRFPVITQPGWPESEPGGKSPPAPLDAGHALVIDDNQVNCTVLVDLLRRLGVPRVYSALSARRGLALLENIQPDLIFIDLQMPDMNGFELIEHLQRSFSRQDRKLPLTIACTAEVSDSKRHQCLDAGFHAHLGKPVTGSALRQLFDSFGVSVAVSDTTAAAELKNNNIHQTADRTQDGPLIEPQDLIDTFLGNEDLLADFLRLLVENLPEHIARIGNGIRTSTIINHAEAAHSIRGLVGYFRNDNLIQQVNTLEVAMKAGDTHLAGDIFVEVERILNQLMQEARDNLKKLARRKK